ncbi:tetratricopeptide repeat protein [Kordiimonas sp. SCSIO 12610]|uniref:tetratricopeptide repeat protein n=1 Tax=Kordiimonas sp. SCSIO 12610 TaxID=2829597 RepID=UPI00210D02B2|nr:tetratricopeptide repeat protein [Kordiimonas sp. SCSIO 12610]UTW56726.1 tetratricopeptide repeat protein [Kordiimonas sp. SCSIO 12610]
MQIRYSILKASLILLFVLSSFGENIVLGEGNDIDTASEPVQAARTLFAQGELAEAIKQLKAIEETSSDPNDHLNIAEIYNALQDGIAAEVAVDKAIELGADLSIARVYKARALLVQRKFQTALALFRAFDIPEELSGKGLQAQAEAFFGAGQYEAANEIFRTVLKNDPENLEALKGLAQVALQTGNLAAAKTIAEKAQTIDADDTIVHYVLGSVSRFEGNTHDARSHLNKSIELFPQNILSLLELAAIEVAEKKFEASNSLLDQVYILYPEHPQAIYISAQIEALKGEYVEAEILLVKLTQYASVYPPVNHLYGIVAYRLENYSTAISNLRNFLEVVPSHRETRLVLADSYKQRVLYREALAVLMPLLPPSNPKGDFDALMLAASVATSAGKPDDGLKYLLQASNIKTGSTESAESIDKKLVYSNVLAGNYETAETILKQIQKSQSEPASNEDRVQDLMVLANIQIKKRAYDEALATAKTLISLSPDKPEAYNLLAGIYSQANRITEAVEAYSKALELNDTYILARRNRALLYIRTNELDLASADLYAVLEKQAEDIRARAILGRVELLRENYTSAINNLEIAQEAFPGSLDVTVDYIEALFLGGYVSKALSELDKANELEFANNNPALVKRLKRISKEILSQSDKDGQNN